MTNASIRSLFLPTSIAVIGISRDDTSVGSTIYRNIKEGGFQGDVIPVNPFIQNYHDTICYPSVLSIPSSVDLAVIVVPAAVVPSVLEEVGKKGIPAAIIISSGFSETGAEGKTLETKIKDIAKKYTIIIVGPNCLGIINTHEKLNASFARTKPLPGTIAFLSQSGALGSALLDIITPKGIGVSHFISLGNKAGINELDILQYLSEDEQTNVIGMYVEQLQDADKLIALGRAIQKPIVVLKGGKTEEGSLAVHSHTGSLAGGPEAYRALFQQACMIHTASTQDFINTLVSFSQNPIPKGNTCAILTNAGGPAILATDTLTQNGVAIPEISGKHNPIDLLGDANASDFQQTLSLLEKNDAVDSILGIVTPQAVTPVTDCANAFCMYKTTSTKPLAVCFMGDDVMKEGRKILEMGKIPTSKYPEQTAMMLANIHTYAKMKARIYVDVSQPVSTEPVPAVQISLSDPLTLLAAYGIPVPSYGIALDTSSITPSFLSHLSETVVIKILSKQIIHKTDRGAVRLNVSKKDVQETANVMLEHIQKTIPDARVDGILIMDMAQTEHSLECIIGIKKEEGLGTLIMLGIGGIFVEIIKDVTFRFAPLTTTDAQDLIAELQSNALFDGVRGKPALDKEALTKTLLTVSRIALDHPEITELDINPILVFPTGQGVLVLDSRVTISTNATIIPTSAYNA